MPVCLSSSSSAITDRISHIYLGCSSNFQQDFQHVPPNARTRCLEWIHLDACFGIQKERRFSLYPGVYHTHMTSLFDTGIALAELLQKPTQNLRIDFSLQSEIQEVRTSSIEVEHFVGAARKLFGQKFCDWIFVLWRLSTGAQFCLIRYRYQSVDDYSEKNSRNIFKNI